MKAEDPVRHGGSARHATSRPEACQAATPRLSDTAPRHRAANRASKLRLPMPTPLRAHWPEYVMEAAGLGLFMLSAAGFATLIHHPSSPVRQHVADPALRRLLMGAAMGVTAMALIYSPIGARSGAHLNPATTVTFYRLGRVRRADAFGYIAAQFAGGLIGIALAARLLSPWIGAPEVNYVATVPGAWGAGVAFLAEAAITFLLMTMVLHASAHRRWSRYTGVLVGLTVAAYITLEDPLSGMSMNPARSFGPALFAGTTASLWIYFVAPPLGMLLAAEAFVRRAGAGRVFCAKLHHHNRARCIFDCRFGELLQERAAAPGPAPAAARGRERDGVTVSARS
jgi:aquaporin Z